MPTCMQSEAIVSNVVFRRHAGLKHSDKVAAFDLVGFFLLGLLALSQSTKSSQKIQIRPALCRTAHL